MAASSAVQNCVVAGMMDNKNLISNCFVKHCVLLLYIMFVVYNFQLYMPSIHSLLNWPIVQSAFFFLHRASQLAIYILSEVLVVTVCCNFWLLCSSHRFPHCSLALPPYCSLACGSLVLLLASARIRKVQPDIDEGKQPIPV